MAHAAEFWLSPCLLPARAEVADVATALLALESAGPSRGSVELLGEQDILDVNPGLGPGSLASSPSDGSAQAPLSAEKESAPLAPAHDHVRDAKHKAVSPAGDSERGTRDYSGSKAAVKRRRNNDDENNTGKTAKQRHTKHLKLSLATGELVTPSWQPHLCASAVLRLLCYSL